jgi:hypothetical protein
VGTKASHQLDNISLGGIVIGRNIVRTPNPNINYPSEQRKKEFVLGMVNAGGGGYRMTKNVMSRDLPPHQKIFTVTPEEENKILLREIREQADNAAYGETQTNKLINIPPDRLERSVGINSTRKIQPTNTRDITRDEESHDMALYNITKKGEPELVPNAEYLGESPEGKPVYRGISHPWTKEHNPTIRFRTEPGYHTHHEKVIALSGIDNDEAFTTKVLGDKKNFVDLKKGILFAQEKESLPDDTPIYSWFAHSYNQRPLMKIKDLKQDKE